MKKCLVELTEPERYKEELRRLIRLGCSLYYACELSGIELPTGRVLLGDYNKVYERMFIASNNKGFTKDEMGARIVQIFLDSKDGQGMKAAAKELNLNLSTTGRYLARYLKDHLPYPEIK